MPKIEIQISETAEKALNRLATDEQSRGALVDRLIIEEFKRYIAEMNALLSGDISQPEAFTSSPANGSAVADSTVGVSSLAGAAVSNNSGATEPNLALKRIPSWADSCQNEIPKQPAIIICAFLTLEKKNGVVRYEDLRQFCDETADSKLHIDKEKFKGAFPQCKRNSPTAYGRIFVVTNNEVTISPEIESLLRERFAKYIV